MPMLYPDSSFCFQCSRCESVISGSDAVIRYDLDDNDPTHRPELVFQVGRNLTSGAGRLRFARTIKIGGIEADVILTSVYCSICEKNQRVQPLGWRIDIAPSNHPLIRENQYILKLSNLKIRRKGEYVGAANIPFKFLG